MTPATPPNESRQPDAYSGYDTPEPGSPGGSSAKLEVLFATFCILSTSQCKRFGAHCDTSGLQATTNEMFCSGYMGVHPQAWSAEQSQSWNWSADATEFTPGEPFCGNVAFFVPFPGMVGGVMPNASTTEGSNGEMQQPSELHEMEAKMAALQAENERLTQLYEAECQLRHIEVTAYNQVFEMYAVPKAEAEEFARRLQVETVSNEESYQSGAMAGAIPMETPDVTGNTTSVETLLKETFPHIKIHSLDDPPEHQIAGDEEALVGDDADAKTDEEELEQHLFQLQSMVGSAIDERAKQTLLSLPPEHGKAALGKVEDIIHEQGGVCRNLSSMVQSVCRKVGHSAGMKQ